MEARIALHESKTLMKYIKGLVAASRAVEGDSLPAATQELVKIRVSQINGCAACTDMHTKDAAEAGETSVRLNLIAVWREATVFTDAERAALAVAEEATRIADHHTGVSDDTWALATKHYDEEGLAGLTALIATMNAFNRLNVIARTPAGNYVPGAWS